MEAAGGPRGSLVSLLPGSQEPRHPLPARVVVYGKPYARRFTAALASQAPTSGRANEYKEKKLRRPPSSGAPFWLPTSELFQNTGPRSIHFGVVQSFDAYF